MGTGGGSADEGEDIDVLEIALPDAMQMISRGDIRDAKTIILLQHLTIRLCRKSTEHADLDRNIYQCGSDADYGQTTGSTGRICLT